MYFVIIIIISVGFISSTQSGTYISDDTYHILPPIFHIDSYEKCTQQKDLFCRVFVKLAPLNIEQPSEIWKSIEKLNKSKESYRHDELFHVICVNRAYYIKTKNDKRVLEQNISEIYTKKYKSIGLRPIVENIDCEIFKYKLKVFDIILMFFIVSYLSFVIVATLHDTKTKVERKRIIILFSLRYNLLKLKNIYTRTDFGKLKCIQALRFYTTILIIFCHTFCSFAGGYVANTKYFEEIPQNVLKLSLRILFVFLVQTFFLISGWLLSYHTFKIMKKIKDLNIYKYAVVTFCNRYLRIIPPVLVMVCLDSSIWIYGNFQGPVKYIYSDREYERCQRNWWINFLFLSNHYRQEDMCYFTLWYLSADTQLYILSLICLIFIHKFRQWKILILVISFLVGIMIPTTVSFLYDLDIIYKITPENSKNNKFFTFKFSASYTSTYANMATYMMGLIFGYIYYRFEHKKILENKYGLIFWWFLSISLPLLVIIASFFEYNTPTSAILSGILKPIYALGIGMAIFGMSHKFGGLVQKVCEWKPAVFMGNFTYSTYVVHFGIVFYRTATTLVPLEVSDYIMITSFLQDSVLSFGCGFFIHVVLEMPLLELQRLLVPKYSISDMKSKFKKS